MQTKLEPVEQMRTRARASNQSWMVFAASIHDVGYALYPLGKDTLTWLEQARPIRDETCPLELRKAVLHTGRQTSLFGEDIYIVDGRADHVIWMTHQTCNTSALLHRGDGLYCATCHASVSQQETI